MSAKRARLFGGFQSRAGYPRLAGQQQVVGIYCQLGKRSRYGVPRHYNSRVRKPDPSAEGRPPHQHFLRSLIAGGRSILTGVQGARPSCQYATTAAAGRRGLDERLVNRRYRVSSNPNKTTIRFLKIGAYRVRSQ
jgi:hypothetical protein